MMQEKLTEIIQKLELELNPPFQKRVYSISVKNKITRERILIDAVNTDLVQNFGSAINFFENLANKGTGTFVVTTKTKNGSGWKVNAIDEFTFSPKTETMQEQQLQNTPLNSPQQALNGFMQLGIPEYVSHLVNNEKIGRLEEENSKYKKEIEHLTTKVNAFEKKEIERNHFLEDSQFKSEKSEKNWDKAFKAIDKFAPLIVSSIMPNAGGIQQTQDQSLSGPLTEELANFVERIRDNNEEEMSILTYVNYLIENQNFKQEILLTINKYKDAN